MPAFATRNVRFEQGDAQVQAFPADHFDLCISRFGTMFFAESATAFANIARAIRPGVRLVWDGVAERAAKRLAHCRSPARWLRTRPLR